MKTIITNMCLIKNSEGKLLFLKRKKSTWPGITFPGGHVENNETYLESVVREIKEETNLDIYDVKYVGKYEWNSNFPQTKEIGLFYFTSSFKGELKSSIEGECFFAYLKDINKDNYSLDFDIILNLYKDYI